LYIIADAMISKIQKFCVQIFPSLLMIRKMIMMKTARPLQNCC